MIAEQLRNHSFAVIFRRVQLVIRDSFPPEILKQIPPSKLGNGRDKESPKARSKMARCRQQRNKEASESMKNEISKIFCFKIEKKKTEKEPSENVGQSRQESRWL